MTAKSRDGHTHLTEGGVYAIAEWADKWAALSSFNNGHTGDMFASSDLLLVVSFEKVNTFIRFSALTRLGLRLFHMTDNHPHGPPLLRIR